MNLNYIAIAIFIGFYVRFAHPEMLPTIDKASSIILISIIIAIFFALAVVGYILTYGSVKTYFESRKAKNLFRP